MLLVFNEVEPQNKNHRAHDDHARMQLWTDVFLLQRDRLGREGIAITYPFPMNMPLQHNGNLQASCDTS